MEDVKSCWICGTNYDAKAIKKLHKKDKKLVKEIEHTKAKRSLKKRDGIAIKDTLGFTQ